MDLTKVALIIGGGLIAIIALTPLFKRFESRQLVVAGVGIFLAVIGLINPQELAFFGASYKSEAAKAEVKQTNKQFDNLAIVIDKMQHTLDVIANPASTIKDKRVALAQQKTATQKYGVVAEQATKARKALYNTSPR